MSVKIEPIEMSSFEYGIETITTESSTTTEDTTSSEATSTTSTEESTSTENSTSTEESTTTNEETAVSSTVLAELTTLASTVEPEFTTFQPTVQTTTLTAAQTTVATTTTNSLVYELIPICNSASATYYLSIGSQIPYNTLGGSGRVLKDCSITNAEIKGSVACKSAFDAYGYNYNCERTVLYIVVPDCTAMTGYYYLDDCCAANNVVDFYFGEAQNCPFQFTGRLFNIEVYLRA